MAILVDAPFSCSDRYCDILKKEPAHRYSKETGNTQFVGTLAASGKWTRPTVFFAGDAMERAATAPKSFKPLTTYKENAMITRMRRQGTLSFAYYDSLSKKIVNSKGDSLIKVQLDSFEQAQSYCEYYTNFVFCGYYRTPVEAIEAMTALYAV